MERFNNGDAQTTEAMWVITPTRTITRWRRLYGKLLLFSIMYVLNSKKKCN